MAEMQIRGTQIKDGVIRPDGSVAFAADQSMGGHKATNAADPTGAQDLTTKSYVDARSGAGATGETPGGAVNGSNTHYTTAAPYPAGTLKVFRNGLRLVEADFTETGGSTFDVNVAPETGDLIRVDYGGPGAVSGALILLEQHAASSSAQLDFTGWYSSAYDEYLIEFINIRTGTAGAFPWLRMSTDGGATYDAGANYSYDQFGFRVGASGLGGVASGATKIVLSFDAASGLATTANQSMTGSLRLYSPGGALYKHLHGQIHYFDNAGPVRLGVILQAAYESTTPVNALRILMSTGNIASGTIRIYGVAK